MLELARSAPEMEKREEDGGNLVAPGMDAEAWMGQQSAAAVASWERVRAASRARAQVWPRLGPVGPLAYGGLTREGAGTSETSGMRAKSRRDSSITAVAMRERKI